MRNFLPILLVLFFSVFFLLAYFPLHMLAQSATCRLPSFAQPAQNNPNTIPLTDELPFHLDVFPAGEVYISGRVSTFMSEECYLSKHDKDGNFLWAKIIGGTGYDYFQKTIEFDNAVFCGGNTTSSGQNLRDFYLVKFDQNGDTLCTKILGGYRFDQMMDLYCNGSNILTGGFSNSFGAPGNNDILLIYSDSSGNPLWAKSVEAGGEDILHSIKKSSDGGFIIAGNTTSFGSGMKDIFSLKIDSAGNFEWLKCLGGADDEDAIDLMVENGGIYITGYTKSLSGAQDLWIIKLDSTGNLLWNKVIDFGLNEKGNKIFSRNGSIFVCGYMQSMTGTMDDIFVLSIDESGNNISAKQFEITGSEFGNFIGESNGKLFIAGYQTNNSKMKIFEMDDFLFSCNSSALTFDTLSMQLIITDTFFTVNSIPIDSVIQNKGGDLADYGNPAVTVDICLLPVNTLEGWNRSSWVKIFPNPNDGKFTIQINDGSDFFDLKSDNEEIELFNMQGIEIFKSNCSISNARLPARPDQYSFDIPCGIYFLKIISADGIYTEKVIVSDF